MNDCLNTLSWQFVTLLVKKLYLTENLQKNTQPIRWFFILVGATIFDVEVKSSQNCLTVFFLFFVCQMCNSNYASSIVLNVCTVHMSSHVKCLRSTHLFRWTNGWTISRIRIRFGMSQQKSHAKSFISTKAKEKKRSNSRVNSTLDLTRYTILMMRFIFPELDKIFQEI